MASTSTRPPSEVILAGVDRVVFGVPAEGKDKVLPILDKGIYLLAADESGVLAALDRDDRPEVRRLVAATMRGGRGYAVKVANPGGPTFWKRGRRGAHRDLDTPLPGGDSAVREALFAFAPDALGPSCGTARMMLYSEKNPQKPDTKTLDAAVLAHIAQDFEPFRQQP